MGTGKSALGRKLAEHWRMRYIDADAAIEQLEKKTISEIFEQEGEAAFRQKEKTFLESGHPAHGCVISLGGGAVCQEGVIELLRQKGVLLCLFASPETILARTRHCTHRPLLNVPDPRARIEELLAQREPCYKRAGIGVLTDGRSMAELVQHIDRIYRGELKRFEL